eukprot:636350-Amphidinium_carterae.1
MRVEANVPRCNAHITGLVPSLRERKQARQNGLNFCALKQRQKGVFEMQPVIATIEYYLYYIKGQNWQGVTVD